MIADADTRSIGRRAEDLLCCTNSFAFWTLSLQLTLPKNSTMASSRS